MSERIAEIGYLAGDPDKHVLISVYGAALVNSDMTDKSVQFAITVDGAIRLRAELNVFLARHGVVPQ